MILRKTRYILTLFLLMSFVFADAQVNYRHFVTRARHELAEGRFADAMTMLNKAIGMQPNNFEGYFLRGLAKYNLHDLNGACADFDKTLALHPLYIHALQYRGICNQKLNNHEAALADFAQVIEVDPFNADVYSARAVTFLQLARYQDAIDDNDMALSIKPNLVMAYVNRGIAKSNLDRYEEALNDIDKAAQLDVFNPDVYFKRAMVNAYADSSKAALADLDKALDLDDKNPLYYYNRATTYLQLGDTTAAMDDYETVNKLDKRNALTYFNRGVLYAKLNDYQNALLMFDYVTQINPKNIYGYFNRSMVYCELKQWKNAESDLSKVIQLKPDFVGAWMNRAAVRYEKGDEQAANADRRHAMFLVKQKERNAMTPAWNKYSDSTYLRKLISFESDFVNNDNMLNLPQYANAEIKPFPDFVLTAMLNEEYVFVDGKKRFYIDVKLISLNEKLPFKLVVQNSNNGIMPNSISQADFPKADTDVGHLLKAMLYHRDGWYDGAKKMYVSALAGDCREYGLLNLSAMMYEEMEQNATPVIGERCETDMNLDTVIGLLSANIAKNRDNPFVWFNMGNMHLRNKEYNRAIDDFSEAIRLNAELAEAYYNRALTLIFIEETELAVPDLSRAGELGISEAYLVLKRYANK